MSNLNPSQVNPGPIFEGAFAYLPPYYYEPGGGPPYPSVDAGEGALVAGVQPGQSGIAAGRFGWANPASGVVLNSRTTAQDQIGIVIPRRANWESCYLNAGSRWLRKGYQMTLISAGAFWLRFPGGAFRGDPVYADLVDGHAVSGIVSGAELTKFFVTCGCNPGALAQVSTWAKFV
jgi:hypothetical protein